MSMQADLLAIGQLCPEVRECLGDYRDVYDQTPDGTVVCLTVFAVSSTASSRLLAADLGFDPWDFEKHYFMGTDKQEQRLYAQDEYGGWNPCDIRQFQVLRAHHFAFIYRPNG